MLDITETAPAAIMQMAVMSLDRASASRPALATTASGEQIAGPEKAQPPAPTMRVYNDPRLAMADPPLPTQHAAQTAFLKSAQRMLSAQRGEIEGFADQLNRLAMRDPNAFTSVRIRLGGETLTLAEADTAYPAPRNRQGYDRLLERFTARGLLDVEAGQQLRQIYAEMHDLTLQADRALRALNASLRKELEHEDGATLDATIRARVAERFKEQIEDAMDRYQREDKLMDLFDFQDLVERIDLQRLLDKAELMAMLGTRSAGLRDISAKLADPAWQAPHQRPPDAAATLKALAEYAESDNNVDKAQHAGAERPDPVWA